MLKAYAPLLGTVAQQSAIPSVVYLDQAVSFTTQHLQSPSDVLAAHSNDFYIICGFETPTTWSAGVVQTLIAANFGDWFIRFRTDRKMEINVLESGVGVRVVKITTMTFNAATKYNLAFSYSRGVRSELRIDNSVVALDTDTDTAAGLLAVKQDLAIGGAFGTNTNDFKGRVGPLWFSNTSPDLSTAWATYHDGTGFLPNDNGARVYMTWADKASHGSYTSTFTDSGTGTSTLEDW